MLNFNNQPDALSAEKSGGAIQQSASFLKRLLLITLFCALSFMLSAPSLVQAEGLQEGTPAEQPSTNVQPVDTAAPAKLITSAAPETRASAKANTQAGDGLELGPEIIGQPVRQINVKEPTVDPVFYDATTISGGSLAKYRDKVNKKTVIATVHVTLKGEDGTEKANLSVTPTSGTKWSVKLPEGKKIEKGDTVTVYQQIGEDKSSEVTATAQPSKASTVTLTMPTGEIWIEHPDANLVNEDEQAEAIEMLKKVNPDNAQDFKSVKFSIDYTYHAYYEVTYTDGSTSGRIEATGLKIKQVTDTSAAPTIQKVQVTDGQIIVTFAEEVAAGTKFYFVKEFRDGEDKKFGKDGNCTVDKSDSQEMSQAVSVDGKKVTFPINDKVKDLKLGREFGISVKEPHKFRSCAKSEPVITIPDKVAVRDPHKLTDDDKKAIDKAIRDANTVDGTSKLPDGTGDNDGTPAFIEFDKDGNVTIISPNDVEVTWDSNYNPVYQKNSDGTYKLNDGAKVTKFPAKDLVKNIAPKSPAIAVDTDKGEVTITPPGYKNPGEDTDLASYTISYKDASGTEKTVTATRNVDETSGKTTWAADNATVDANTGVITLKVEDIELAGTITAIAKDNGGLEGDTDKLDSDPATKKLETATVSYDRNGGTGEMTGKTVNKGAEYEILPNVFTAPENQKFKTWKIGDTEHKAKDKIRVKEDTSINAIWQDIEVTVSYSPNGGSGSMDSATMKKGSTYKLSANGFTAPENQKFKGWKIGETKYAVGEEITVTEDTTVTAVWEDIMVDVSFEPGEGSGTMDKETVKKGSTFKLPPSKFEAPKNMEFKGWKIGDEEKAVGDEITVNDNTTVTAIWKKIPVTVTYDGNGGQGAMEESKTLYKGDTYKVLASTFTAPENQEFDYWEIDGKKVAADTEITLTKDTVIKAIWEDIMVDVSFEPGEGSGTMDKETVKKGSTFKLPPSKFEAPKNMEFKGWKIGDEEKAVGDEITVNDNTTVTAIWKDIEYKVTFDGNGGSGDMQGKTVKKGTTVELPPNGFTPPSGKVFNGWEINGQTHKVGDSITVNGDVTVKALWKDKPVPPATTPGKGKSGKQAKSQPQNPAASGKLSKTGANGMYSLYASLLLATGGLFVISRRRRAQR